MDTEGNIWTQKVPLVDHLLLIYVWVLNLFGLYRYRCIATVGGEAMVTAAAEEFAAASDPITYHTQGMKCGTQQE